MTELTATLADRLTTLAEKFRVPGAQAAILTPDGVVEAATGVLSLATGVEATTDSVFQIGSISKVWTATLAMKLVDEGLLDLDMPVLRYLPEFRIADPATSAGVTARHLLAHSSGIDGDLFLDTGRGDDAVERYVVAMTGLAALFPLGTLMSYCNSGFTLLGHVIATLRGKTWEQVVREDLFTPLGLTRAGTLPEEALLQRAAVGHVGGADDTVTPAPVWGISRSAGPAGLIHATAAEVLAFVKLHLDGGLAADGTRVLSAESVAEMQLPQITVSNNLTAAKEIGLSWMLHDWGGHRVLGHDGGTIGQLSFCRVFPDLGVAFSLNTNGGGAGQLFDALVEEIILELTGSTFPEKAAPTGDPVAPDSAAGRVGIYANIAAWTEVRRREDGVMVAVQGATQSLLPGESELPEMELLPTADGGFVVHVPEVAGYVSVRFNDLPDGSTVFTLGSRSARKVSDLTGRV